MSFFNRRHRDRYQDILRQEPPLESNLPETLPDHPVEWGGADPFTETVFNNEKVHIALLLHHSRDFLPGARVQRPPADQIDLEVDPVQLISFKELEMSKIESAIKMYDQAEIKQANLRPLRNYLEAKKQGSNIFMAMWVDKIPEKESDERFVQIKFNKEFLERLAGMFTNPAISFLMKVERHYVEGDLVPIDIFSNKNVSVADLLTPGNKLGWIVLNQVSWSGDVGRELGKPTSFTFSWVLRLEFDNAPNKIPLHTDGNSVLLKLYGMDDSTKEIAIVARDGVEVKCHKNILMAQGDSFASFFSSGHVMAEAKEFQMKNNSVEAVCLFVRFLYGMEIPLEDILSDPNLALELLQMANLHGVQSLESFMASFLGQQGMNYFTPDTILELFVYTEVPESLAELNAHAFAEISTLPVETLRTCEYFQSASQTAQEIPFRLLLKLRE